MGPLGGFRSSRAVLTGDHRVLRRGVAGLGARGVCACGSSIGAARMGDHVPIGMFRRLRAAGHVPIGIFRPTPDKGQAVARGVDVAGQAHRRGVAVVSRDASMCCQAVIAVLRLR